MKDYQTAVFVLLFITQSAGLSLVRHDQATANFCWKDSYGRGVGTLQDSCGALEKIGQLCYPKCPAGYSRVGTDCQQNCPAGWTDQFQFCRFPDYGRGYGYPWKFGDELNDNGMIDRCEKDNGKGNCEKFGKVFFPKCKPGYSAFGCCICRPAVPDCNALGFNSGYDLSCTKKVITGAAKDMGCAIGLE